MTFQQLGYVLEICNSGSISKAARSLFVSQSAISASIQELEEELGIDLFVRTNRGTGLTEEGEEFVAQIRPIIEQQKKIQRYYLNKSYDDATRRINISAQRFPFCTKAFVLFLKKHGGEHYEYTFKETDMDKVIENVSSRKSDVGIICLSDLTERFMSRVLTTYDLEFTELKRIRPQAYLSATHPLADRKEVQIEELKDYPYIAFSRRNNESANFSEEAVLSSNVEFNKMIYINDRATFCNMMQTMNAFSTGTGIIPKGYGDEGIVTIPLSKEQDYLRLGYVKLKGFELSTGADYYIKILRELMQES